jgi:hypothetical protein
MLMRRGGLAAVLGGGLLILSTILHALKPTGCVADECDLPGRSMREGTAVTDVLLIAAVLLMGLGLLTVVARLRAAGRFGRLGQTGVAATSLGGALGLAGVLVQALFFGSDFPYMPFFLVPGLLGVMVGVLFLGAAILRSGVLPRWVGVLLASGAICLLAFNEQTARVLLAIPIGVAWVAMGSVLWAEPRPRPAA